MTTGMSERPAAPQPISAEQLRRLRWHCRRGLLENDLVLERFLQIHGRDLDQTRLTVLNELLALGDNELWALIVGRAETHDPRQREILGWIRAA